MLLGVGTYAFSYTRGKNDVYFADIPTLGAVAKKGGGSDFYYADSVKSFEGEGFELTQFFAYFDENRSRIDLSFSVKCTGDNEAFVREYGALYTEVEETQEMKTLSGKTLKKLVGSCKPHVRLEKGELKGDTVDFYGSYKYSLGDRMFNLSTKHINITFELKEMTGYKTLKKISKRISFGNGICLYIADGEHFGTTGVFALIESDGSAIPQKDINERTDIKFIDSDGRQITKDIFPSDDCNEMFENREETPYYFCDISLNRISAVKLTLSGTRMNPSAAVDLLSETVAGHHFVYYGSYLKISDVNVVDDGITFKAAAVCDNELNRRSELVFEAAFEERGEKPYIEELETGYTSQRMKLGNFDGEVEYKIHLKNPEKLSECFICAGASLEYTATIEL